MQLGLQRAAEHAVLLGTVAYRAGKKLEWDAEKNWVKNSNPRVEALLTKQYRPGW